MASLLRKANATALREKDGSDEASTSRTAASTKNGKRKAVGDEAEGSAAATRRNKQRVLLIPSRGVTSQMRHLVSDLESLMPQSKKGENDSGGGRGDIAALEGES